MWLAKLPDTLHASIRCDKSLIGATYSLILIQRWLHVSGDMYRL